MLREARLKRQPSKRVARAARGRGRGRPRGTTLTRDRVVEAALELVAKRGPSALGVGQLARALGIQPASLYNHIRDVDELHARVATVGYGRLLSALSAAATKARSAPDCIHALARAYREFARGQASLYRVMTARPLPDGQGKETLRSTLFGLLAPPLGALGVAPDHMIHAIRSLRCALAGFCALDLAGEFELPASSDESFEYLVRALAVGVASQRA